MPRKPKIAIVGLGHWGKNLLREFELISAVTLVHHYGQPSYENILNQPEIEAVVIATPIATHYALAKAALEAGKHVLVEKPIAASVEQAKDLVALAKKKKLILAVGHVFLYHPVLDKITELLAGEKIKYLETSWYKYGTFVEDIKLNLLAHDLALMLYLMGKPDRLTLIRREGVVSDGDIIAAAAKFGTEKKADFYINRVAPFKSKSVLLKTASTTLWWLDDELWKLTDVGYQSVFKSEQTPLELECAEFVESLNTGTKLRVNGEFGLLVLEQLARI